VPLLEVFVGKLIPIDRFATSALCNIASAILFDKEAPQLVVLAEASLTSQSGWFWENKY
jgi:hypothetical protein